MQPKMMMQIFNSNSLDDGIGQELSQGLSSAMQFSTKRDKEDMAQPTTPVLPYAPCYS
jgi:hypothetical protein